MNRDHDRANHDQGRVIVIPVVRGLSLNLPRGGSREPLASSSRVCSNFLAAEGPAGIGGEDHAELVKKYTWKLFPVCRVLYPGLRVCGSF